MDFLIVFGWALVAVGFYVERSPHERDMKLVGVIRAGFAIWLVASNPLAAQSIVCRATRTAGVTFAGACIKGDSTFGDLRLERPKPSSPHLWMGTIQGREVRSAASGGAIGQSEFGVDVRPGGALRLGRAWLALTGVRRDNATIEFAFRLDASAPPTDEDVNILRHARAYLADSSRWNRADTTDMNAAPTRGFGCFPAQRQSMFCAVYLASVNLTSDYAHFRPALNAVRSAVLATGKEYRHPLVDFNNDTSRTLPEVLSVLDAAIATVVAQRSTQSADTLAAPGRHGISVPSSADGSLQPSYVFVPPRPPAGASSYPVAVLLHTWSFDLEQRSAEVEAGAAARGWLLVQPNFRGRSDNPSACGSPLVQQDILDAVNWVRQRYAVDSSRIYLLGLSGGGYMTMLMAARHPAIWAAGSAWVGISDLNEWYGAHTADNYGRMIRACLAGDPTVVDSSRAEARRRSPRTYLSPKLTVPLDMAAGRYDSVVSPAHTLRAFDAIAPRAISEAEIAQLLAAGNGLIAPSPADTVADSTFARRIFLRRVAGPFRVTIFEGGHEWRPDAALAWLATQQKPPR